MPDILDRLESASLIAATGQQIIVDADLVEMLSGYRWSVNNYGYAVHTFKRNRIQHVTIMHRLILGLPPGKRPIVDHVNGNTLDNRRANLRICTFCQNAYNRKRRSDNVSGVKGVSWSKSANQWVARISVNRKPIYLGAFRTKELAAEFRELAAEMAHGEFANHGVHHG